MKGSWCTRLDRTIAVKVLPPEFSADPERRARFEREARTIAGLNHPHICTIHDIGEAVPSTRSAQTPSEDSPDSPPAGLGRAVPFIVIELLEEQTLQQHIGARPLARASLVDLAIKIADALEAGHARGIIHRDIKPSNIFVTTRGEAKVLDFGLAKLAPVAHQVGTRGASDLSTMTPAESLATSLGTPLGTVAYMSPEQIRREALDGRTDLFSFGLVLYEMATGRQAYSGPTPGAVLEAILNRLPPPARSVSPELGSDLKAVIAKALEKDRRLRYQTVADLKADLRRLKRDSELPRVAVICL